MTELEDDNDEDDSSSSIFRFLPFGAGSRGVRLYVTVRVTTDLTETGLTLVLLGDSRYRRWSSDQSAGENGDRAEVAIVLGVSQPGEQIGEVAGIRRRRNEAGPLLILRGGGAKVEFGPADVGVGAMEVAGDLMSSEHEV